MYVFHRPRHRRMTWNILKQTSINLVGIVDAVYVRYPDVVKQGLSDPVVHVVLLMPGSSDNIQVGEGSLCQIDTLLIGTSSTGF